MHRNRGLDGATPTSVFDTVERDALMPLPRRQSEPVVYTVGTVGPDCHDKSGKAFYSAPWRLLGQRGTIRAAGDVVQIFHHAAVVATHVLHYAGRAEHP